MNFDCEKTLKELTLNEKIALVSGTDYMYTNPIERLDIPALCMADGPHGLRKQKIKGDSEVSKSELSTAFPSASATASGWTPENTRKMGAAIASECRYYGVDILLGPGVNIQKNPLCGRNFEYFSEDPILASEMASGEIDGLHSGNVGVSLKHFALNNSENYRFMGNSIADMRAIRDIYLKAFEYIVKKARPDTVMCAYNRINGVYCSENKWLIEDVLRGEWGFDGAVMTDWGAVRDRVSGILSGLDLEMPGDTAICRKKLSDALKSGALPEEVLDRCVLNVLRLIERLHTDDEPDVPDFEKHNILAAEIAADSAVLMKNDGTLPLDKNGEFFVCGELFEKMRYQGSGSSMINAFKVTSPRDAFDARGIRYSYSKGYSESSEHINESLIKDAVSRSAEGSTAIVFAGLTDLIESEGCDRENMRLPKNQLALINALIDAGRSVVVVLSGGSPVELPFADRVCAVLNMFLPGQNGGNAAAQLLFGEKNPCGKLAQTWVKSYDDIPFGAEFGKTQYEIYKESVFVGYRYYLTAHKDVAFPFGFGLSYTSFEYSEIKVEESGSGYDVSLSLLNSGKYDGAEVVQLYISAPETGVFKPERELRAFKKVYLKSGETQRVKLHFDTEELCYYNISEQKRVIENGEYQLLICSDCTNVRLRGKIKVSGYSDAVMPYDEKVSRIYRSARLCDVTNDIFTQMSGTEIPSLPPRFPFTVESRFSDLRHGVLGRLFYNAALSYVKLKRRRAEKIADIKDRENMIKGAVFLRRILDSNSLHSMSMSSGKLFPYNFAEGLAALANGKLIRGIRHLCTSIKAPKLPKKAEKSDKADKDKKKQGR